MSARAISYRLSKENIMHKNKNWMKIIATVSVVAFAIVVTFSRQSVGVYADTDGIPNNLPQHNPGGMDSTFSTRGSVDFTGEFFQAQGTNGRSCGSCHTAGDAWSITPGTLQEFFDATDGTHPVFNELDANNPDGIDSGSTLEERRAAYSMLLTKGVFRRGGTPRANSEWELIAVEDPHGYANVNRLVHWRRSMPTANFSLGSATVNWDGGNSVGTDQHAGLVNQATRNVTGGQQGPPAPAEVIAEIVAFEESLFAAQMIVPGVGRLDSGGARGGPEPLSSMPKVAGRFDLFDAWIAHGNPRRAQIAPGRKSSTTNSVQPDVVATAVITRRTTARISRTYSSTSELHPRKCAQRTCRSSLSVIDQRSKYAG